MTVSQRVVARLRNDERALYTLVAAAFTVLAVGVTALKPNFNFAVSDGVAYYVYLPSFVVDGDLDFRNQMVEHWGVDFKPSYLEDLTATGIAKNKYPIGLALTLLPAFSVAHVLSLVFGGVTGAPAFAPNGYTLLYQLSGLITVILLGYATMLMVHRLLCRDFGLRREVVMAAVLFYWAGTMYTYYYFREPFMSHVVSAFWVTCAWTIFVAMRSAYRPLLPAALIFCMAMAGVTRPTNAFIGVAGLVLLGSSIRNLFPRTLAGVALCVLALLPIAAQITTWRILYGDWVTYSYEDDGFHWGNPQLLRTLFSSRHGLFFWSPMLLFSVAGLVAGWRTLVGEQRRHVLALGAGAITLWYLNSAWAIWWFGDAFGARAFIELTPLFILGLALWLAWLDLRPRHVRRVGFAVLIGTAVYSLGLMFLYMAKMVPRSEVLF